MDLARSNTEWARFKRRMSAAISYARYWLHILERHSRERVLYIEDDPNGNTLPGTPILFSGLQPGVNTTDRLKLFCRVTSGSNPRTAAFYKAAGAGSGDKVAEGTANAGATATCTPQNNSGLTVTYPIDATVTPDADDLHVLELYMGWRSYFAGVFVGDDGFDEDAKSRDSIGGHLNRNEARARDGVLEAIQLMFSIMVSDLDNARAWGAKFLKESFFTLLSESAEQDGSGGVVTVRTGALPSLLMAMVDESVATTPTVRERVVEADAGVAESGNVGQLTIPAHTPEGQCPVSDVTLTCTLGYGSPGGGGGREEFSVVVAVRGTDIEIPLSKPLRIGQAYRGELGFGGLTGLTVKRVLTKDGDGSNVNLAVMTDASWAFTGEDENNTSAGRVYWLVSVVGGLNSYKFYSRDSMDAGDLVAESVAGVADGAVFQAAAKNGSQLSIVGKAGSNPVDAATGYIDLNFARIANDANVPDRYRIAINLDAQGEISRVLAALPILGQNGYRLNGVPSGETWSDDLVKANGYPDVIGETEAA